MKRVLAKHTVIFTLLAIMLLLFANVAQASENRQKLTIIGEVNEESQIVARDGAVYEI